MKLDSALDDMIKSGRKQGGGKKGNGKGKGENKKQGGKKAAGANKPQGVKKPAFEKKAKKEQPAKKGMDVGKALDMSLEDIVKMKSKKTPKAAGNAGVKKGAMVKTKKLGAFASKQNRRADNGGKGKGKKQWAQGGNKGNQKGGQKGRKGGQKGWEREQWEAPRKQNWGKGKGRDSWSNERNSGGKGKGRDWGSRKGGGKSYYDDEDQWEPAPRAMYQERRSSESYVQKGAGRSRVSEWEDVGVRTSRPQPLGRDWAVRGQRREDEGPSSRTGRKIKVTNIPRDLDMRDIKDAFEAEAGKIASCTMERGVAWIVFTNPKDAQKAVDTFDRGELNGKTISVHFDK